MNELTTRLNQLPQTADTMESLRMNLRRIDPEYAAEKNAFQSGVQSLKTILKSDSIPYVDALLAAQEDRIAACLLYLFWQGLHQNECCFRDPANKRFLELDFEDICQESVLNSLPEAFKVYERHAALYRQLSEEQKELAYPLTSYYSYLETVGYKLAHYWGFRYGDELLSRVIPGYVPDIGLTAAYRRMLQNYLRFDPEG